MGEPFFIVGCERSGTTLLRVMINSHPKIYMPKESHFIPLLFQKYGAKDVLAPQQVEEIIEFLSGFQRWLDWGMNQDALAKALKGLKHPTLSEVVSSVFEMPMEAEGKERWGDKTPKYVACINEINSLYPNAKFIHIVRDGRDVCISFLKTNWLGPWVSKIANHWKERVYSSRDGQQLGKERYLEVKYEELVLAPDEVLESVCEFLGEAFSEQMLEHNRNVQGKVADREIRLHRKLDRKPMKTDINRWQSELSWFNVLLFESYAHKELADYGYNNKFSRTGALLYPVVRWWIKLLSGTARFRAKIGLHRKSFSSHS